LKRLKVGTLERSEKREARKMPGFPTQTVGTPTNRGKARRYDRRSGPPELFPRMKNESP